MQNWNSKHIYLLLLCFFLMGVFSRAWPVRAGENNAPDSSVLSAALDRPKAPVGSMVTLTLTYHLPDEAVLPDEPQIGGIEGLTLIDRKTEPGRIVFRFMIDRLGSWKTGPLSLSYTDKSGHSHSLTAEPVTLTVESNLGEKPEEAQLKPIKDIMPIKTLWLKYLPWGAGTILLLILLYILARWVQSHRQTSTLINLDPPHIQARKDIDRLQAEGLFERGEVKAFYFRFSEILRQYLEAIRSFPAGEYTTEEISARVEVEIDRSLVHLLKQADLVKFADHVPTPARKEEALARALAYIDQTGPAVVGVDPEGPGVGP